MSESGLDRQYPTRAAGRERLRALVDSRVLGNFIVAVLLLMFYVSAVMATQLFAADFPEWFGSIGASMYSLFQIMTLESWSMGIVRPVMEVYPLAWVFFVPFVIVAEELAHDERLQLMKAIESLRSEVRDLNSALRAEKTPDR